MRNVPQNTPYKNSAIRKIKVVNLHENVQRMPAHQMNAVKSAQVINYRCTPNDLRFTARMFFVMHVGEGGGHITMGQWNFRSLEHSLLGTFVPWNFRYWKGKWHATFTRPPCPKIVVATNCTHGEQRSQDVIPCQGLIYTPRYRCGD